MTCQCCLGHEPGRWKVCLLGILAQSAIWWFDDGDDGDDGDDVDDGDDS